MLHKNGTMDFFNGKKHSRLILKSLYGQLTLSIYWT